MRRISGIDLDQMLDGIQRQFAERYHEDNEHEIPCPFYLVFKADEVLFRAEMDAPARPLNMLLKHFLRMQANEAGCDAYVYISEGWMRHFEKDEHEALPIGPNGLPEVETPISEHPDRVETLILTAGTKSGRRMARICKINRNSPAKPEDALTLYQRFDSLDNEEGCGVESAWDLWPREDVGSGETSKPLQP